jgi:hypothetical protein
MFQIIKPGKDVSPLVKGDSIIFIGIFKELLEEGLSVGFDEDAVRKLFNVPAKLQGTEPGSFVTNPDDIFENFKRWSFLPDTTAAYAPYITDGMIKGSEVLYCLKFLQKEELSSLEDDVLTLLADDLKSKPTDVVSEIAMAIHNLGEKENYNIESLETLSTKWDKIVLNALVPETAKAAAPEDVVKAIENAEEPAKEPTALGIVPATVEPEGGIVHAEVDEGGIVHAEVDMVTTKKVAATVTAYLVNQEKQLIAVVGLVREAAKLIDVAIEGNKEMTTAVLHDLGTNENALTAGE